METAAVREMPEFYNLLKEFTARGSHCFVDNDLNKEDVERKQKEIDFELNLRKFGLYLFDALNCNDKDRMEMFDEFHRVWSEKLKYSEMMANIKFTEKDEKATSDIQSHKDTFNDAFKSIQQILEQKVFKYKISKLQYIGHQNQENNAYHEAISYYSKAISLLNDYDKMNQISLKKHSDRMADMLYAVAVYKKHVNLLKDRVFCLLKLKKYDKCLRDLNKIINLSIIKRDIIEDQISEHFIELTDEYLNCIYLRGKIWLKIGNSAMAVSDFKYLISGIIGSTPEADKMANKSAMRLVKLSENGINQHPSKLTIAKINKYTKRVNKFSKTGWIQLKSKSWNNKLPLKHGHIMVEYDGSLYVFGGTRIVFGGIMYSTSFQRKLDEKLMFLKIDIDLDNNSYKFEKLLFPDKMRIFLCGTDCGYDGVYIQWKRMLTGQKWKNKLIIFGGYNKPFQNVLSYNFDTKRWKCLNIKNMPKILKKCTKLTNHASIIINDTLYVFGGNWSNYNDNESNMFCSLNLISKKWSIITHHNPKNIEIISRNNRKNQEHKIPGSRLDHIIWSDTSDTKNKYIYIAFGNHFRKGHLNEKQRADIWRFNLNKKRWSRQERHGNFPVDRGECGYTQTNDNNVIIFGGYNSCLIHPDVNDNYLKLYAYFGDCFEFESKYNKWTMIQSKKEYPLHRAYPALCLMEKQNILCLYGGYHGGINGETCVYDDIWMLDLNGLTSSKESKKCSLLKVCGYSKCENTETDTKLFRCKGVKRGGTDLVRCVTRYCCKYCQKRDWSRHRVICQKV